MRPDSWEDRTNLFMAFKIENGMQSRSVKSYVSAIKRVLIDDGYQWEDNKLLIGSLTKACRIINDRVTIRLPINCKLLELILFEVNRFYSLRNQHYLNILYQTLFALSYYGLMRVGEVTKSPHVVKACNIHVAKNKEKILVLLYTSKTHGCEREPQKIKITSNRNSEERDKFCSRYFCPFKLMNTYLALRGDYVDETEQFFVFRDKTPVTPINAGMVLKTMIKRLGLNESYYAMHSFRIGRTGDLVKFNYSLLEVKAMGRWRSNVVFKYMRS